MNYIVNRKKLTYFRHMSVVCKLTSVYLMECLSLFMGAAANDEYTMNMFLGRLVWVYGISQSDVSRINQGEKSSIKWVLCLCALTAEKEFNKFQFMSIVQIEILHCVFELIINSLTCHVNDCQMIYIVFEISVEENFKWYKLLFLDELSNILHYYCLNMSLSYLYVEWYPTYLWWYQSKYCMYKYSNFVQNTTSLGCFQT